MLNFSKIDHFIDDDDDVDDDVHDDARHYNLDEFFNFTSFL